MKKRAMNCEESEKLEQIAAEEVNGLKIMEIFSRDGLGFFFIYRVFAVATFGLYTGLKDNIKLILRYFGKLLKTIICSILFGLKKKTTAQVIFLDTATHTRDYYGNVRKELNKKGVKSITIRLHKLQDFSFKRDEQTYLECAYYNISDMICEISDYIYCIGALQKVKLKKVREVFEKYFEWGDISSQLNIFFLTILPESLRGVRIWSRILKIHKPKVILVSEEMSYGVYPIVIACKRMKIPVIAMQHGLITKESLRVFPSQKKSIDEGISSLIGFVLPEKTCVFSRFDFNFLIKHCHYPQNAIEIVGNPRYDEPFNKMNLGISELGKKYNIDNKKKNILWAMNYADWQIREKRKELKIFLQFFSEHKNEYRLIIKPHPFDGVNSYKLDFDKKDADIVLIDQNAKVTMDLIRLSEAVIQINSTVGIEAVMFGRPVLIPEMHLMFGQNQDKCLKFNCGLGFKDSKNLKEAIEQIMDKNSEFSKNFKMNREKFLEYNLANPGKASVRLAEVVLSYIDPFDKT